GLSFAELSIWPSFHIALSNASVFVDFSTKSNISSIRNTSLSLVNMETNTTLLSRTLPNNQSVGKVEFNCSYGSSVESTAWWWSSELQVQWPTFHIAVDRARNHSGSFQVGISTNEHFQACPSSPNSTLFLEVSYMEYNQIGRNSIDKVRARTQRSIKPLRSQSVELSCAFPFTERDFIRVALRSPHTEREVKSSGPLYLSRIFSYKLLVENANAYKSGCEGTITVRLITPPCAHMNGKVLLYKDAGVGRGFGQEEPSSPPLTFNWLTQGENETEFNCSVFYPGRNKYCFRFVFNFSHSPKSWGPWQPWSVCSVSCGEGVRERVRECLLPSGVLGLQCTGMVKEQSLCSLEDCVVLPTPSPSLTPIDVEDTPLGGNMVVVAGISICLAVILATVVVTVWRKLCQTPQCSSVHTGSMHSPGGRKLSDEASICGQSLQGPSLSDSHGLLGGMSVSVAQNDSCSVSPQFWKIKYHCLSRYRLAQQQLKEMKKKGLKEATQLYHVSSSPVHDTLIETSASPTNSPIPTPTGYDETNHNDFHITAPFSELPSQTSRVMPDRLSPRVELVLGPPVSAHASEDISKWHDRTADWVEMVERSGLTGLRGGGRANAGIGNSYHKNSNFRRTSSFTDTKPQLLSSAQFRERSMTQVTYPRTNTNNTSASEKHSGEPGGKGREGMSGIGCPATEPVYSHRANQLSVDQMERAEKNWNRRGPSPIQRNILARKLKEAQSCSGVKGRQRSSTFSVSSSEQRKGRCRSLPMSGDYSSSAGSPYRLSEAEQRMLDVDLSSTYSEIISTIKVERINR
uniref:Thrombospondin, type I, domain containing 1 n=1 Tax=Monopterus albus TaxID=43700 RepID=A0A3Q3JFH9_MONAL